MKKKDLILIGCVLVLAVLGWLIPRELGIFGKTEGLLVKITVEGEEYGTYDLEKDQRIEIGETNVCQIENGEVRMTEADCPDKLCIRQGIIKTQGETIVCLPNKVMIELVSQGKNTKAPIDSIVK